MAVAEKNKKTMSFNKILTIFGVSFIALIIIGILVAKMMVGNPNKKSVSRSIENNQQFTQTQAKTQTSGQDQVVNNSSTQQQLGQNDISTYMNQQEEQRNQISISKQMEAISAQMQALNGQFNQGNNNLIMQMQKMNSDLILLDQRITNLENALRPQNQQMSGKVMKNNDERKQNQKNKGKILNNNLIQASSNGRIWLSETKSSQNTKSYTVGEKVGKYKLIRVDDVHQKVYVN
jgi:Small-conductance mechanosensitive channel